MKGSFSTFLCSIRTYGTTLFTGEVEAITIPGVDGECMVFADQAPFMHALRPGLCTLQRPAHKKSYFFIFGGICFMDGACADIFINQGSSIDATEESSLAAAIKYFQDQVHVHTKQTHTQTHTHT